jgi:hypothetical protein
MGICVYSMIWLTRQYAYITYAIPLIHGTRALAEQKIMHSLYRWYVVLPNAPKYLGNATPMLPTSPKNNYDWFVWATALLLWGVHNLFKSGLLPFSNWWIIRHELKKKERAINTSLLTWGFTSYYSNINRGEVCRHHQKRASMAHWVNYSSA